MEFKKPSAAATVAVFAKDTNSFLLVKRRKNPFKGKYAFPGGYLIVDKEALYQTGIRELEEETGVKIKKQGLVLVDVRSDPKRDPRGHVVDVGFICILDKQAKTSPKADEIPEWVVLDKVEKLDFAFDHKLFFQNLKKYLD